MDLEVVMLIDRRLRCAPDFLTVDCGCGALLLETDGPFIVKTATSGLYPVQPSACPKLQTMFSQPGKAEGPRITVFSINEDGKPSSERSKVVFKSLIGSWAFWTVAQF